jgi:predicted DsbA family dithiol-disulfide isomerase
LQRDYNVEVEWVHFPLHPETPPEGQSLEDMFAGRGYDLAAAQARLRAVAAQENLPYSDRTMTYNSRLAQELGKWADTQEGGDVLHMALFQAFFVDLENLSDPEVLLKIVASAGLSVEEAREVLEQRTFKPQVDQDWMRSAQYGVTGVPTFVAGNYKVVGAQPYEVLELLMKEANAERREG